MAVVETEEHGQVLIVRMNRPERLNALNAELRTALAETWTQFRHATTVRGRDLHRLRARLLRRRGHEGKFCSAAPPAAPARRSRTRS